MHRNCYVFFIHFGMLKKHFFLCIFFLRKRTLTLTHLFPRFVKKLILKIEMLFN